MKRSKSRHLPKAQDAHELDTINFEESKDGSATSFMASLGNGREKMMRMNSLKMLSRPSLKLVPLLLPTTKTKNWLLRAARLMDLLEERGVIGPADGSRPRGSLV